jgi:hypothetical protein
MAGMTAFKARASHSRETRKSFFSDSAGLLSSTGRSPLGHQDAFLRPWLSARYRFSQETFGRMRGKGRDASKAALDPNAVGG